LARRARPAATLTSRTDYPLRTFKQAVGTRDFAVSAEVFLKPETDAGMIREQAALLRERVDGVLLTDNQFGHVHLSTIAAASLLLQHGVDAIVQLACRNRNRIALLSDLLGAAALGVTSLVLIRGEPVPRGFTPRPKAVHDLDALELIATAARLKADEQLSSPPAFFIGGLVTPHAPKPGWVPAKLTAKADAGVQFVLSHICMDVPVLRAYMKQLVGAGLIRRVSVLASFAIPATAADARWLREHRPNVNIPDLCLKRLKQAADPELEGVRLCAELLHEARAIPGIAGAHLYATRNLATIPAALEAAGIDGPGTA